MSENPDKRLADDVRTAAKRLNDAIAEAASYGLRVEVEVVDTTTLSDAEPVMRVLTHVSRPL